jgi:sugar phosphate isomerase/epimerase
MTSLELPLAALLPGASDDSLASFRETLTDAGLSLTVDFGVIEENALAALLPLAARVGARVVRAMPSDILEGARAGLQVGWAAYLAELCHRLDRLKPSLDAHDLILAIENHQDATSDDLLALCEAGGERVGVTLDVANPLAVGEDPLAFAHKVAHRVRNVHLKDYRVYPTESGYRLVRCALGDGAVPLKELIRVLRELAPGAPQHIELAALKARHIRLFEDEWWNGYPPRDARSLMPVLRLVACNACPQGEDWRTPWERGEPDETVVRYEREQFEQSVRFLCGETVHSPTLDATGEAQAAT